MRDFDEARFLRIQSGAAALAEPIAAAIGELIEGGATNLVVSAPPGGRFRVTGATSIAD